MWGNRWRRIRPRSTSGRGPELEVAVTRLHNGRCYRCGELVENGLARVGSLVCHDCRTPSSAITPLS